MYYIYNIYTCLFLQGTTASPARVSNRHGMGEPK